MLWSRSFDLTNAQEFKNICSGFVDSSQASFSHLELFLGVRSLGLASGGASWPLSSSSLHSPGLGPNSAPV